MVTVPEATRILIRKSWHGQLKRPDVCDGCQQPSMGRLKWYFADQARPLETVVWL